MTGPLSTEADVVLARRRARQIAAEIGFDNQDQVRIATSVSEIARNGLSYGGGGRVEYAVDSGSDPQSLIVTVSDKGPGISDLPHVLSGQYQSRTGMGLGLIGAHRLIDDVHIDTGSDGTTVRLSKRLPRSVPLVTPVEIARVIDAIRQAPALDPFAELREQNHELMEASDRLRVQQEELEAVNRELEETNRGVLALYSELEDKAEQLRRAGDARSRFHANVSHELRTPIQSILALSLLLLDRADGDLTDEQERQVRYIRQSGAMLSDIVNDLLDLAKTEAGLLEIRRMPFRVDDLFGGLRGVLRPLRADDAVNLIFEPADTLPLIVSDESKLAQVLRNLISNALKFTLTGEIRVSARMQGEDVRFEVRDSGIGIPSGHLERIFEEFEQAPNPLQARSVGTGLGLSLSRRLARLLGGDLTVESHEGIGSTFALVVPTNPDPSLMQRPARILVADDDASWRYALSRRLRVLGYEPIEADDGEEALAVIERLRPDAVLLDLAMPVIDGYAVLDRLSVLPAAERPPVAVMTSSILDAAARARLSAAASCHVKSDLAQDGLAAIIKEILPARTNVP